MCQDVRGQQCFVTCSVVHAAQCTRRARFAMPASTKMSLSPPAGQRVLHRPRRHRDADHGAAGCPALQALRSTACFSMCVSIVRAQQSARYCALWSRTCATSCGRRWRTSTIATSTDDGGSAHHAARTMHHCAQRVYVWPRMSWHTR